jgi:cytochrome P450
MSASAESLLNPQPAHVAPGLIRPYPFRTGTTTKKKPHGFIAAIHEGPDIFWATHVYHGVRGAWVPRRLEMMQQIFADHEHFSSRAQMPVQELIGENWQLLPAEIDPPKHGMYRAVLNPVFSPSKMAALDNKIREYAGGFVLAFRDRGHCEFMSEFAFEFPIKVFLELMGLPQEQAKQFLIWENGLLKNPRDDLISFALNADFEGRKMDSDELMGFCFLMFLGGLDTVSVNIAWQFLHLAEHQDDQAALRANPKLIPEAIDELMRAYAAVTISRECIKETRIGDAVIMPGDKVMLPTYLAGRDPAAFVDPGLVSLSRKPRHVSFGFGVHFCIGMHLARREMRIAMEEVFSNIPMFRLAPGAELEYKLGQVMSPIAIPLVWDA